MRSTTLTLLMDLAGHPPIQLHHCERGRSGTGEACFEPIGEIEHGGLMTKRAVMRRHSRRPPNYQGFLNMLQFLGWGLMVACLIFIVCIVLLQAFEWILKK
jgi:hypothetical protein